MLIFHKKLSEDDKKFREFCLLAGKRRDAARRTCNLCVKGKQTYIPELFLQFQCLYTTFPLITLVNSKPR